MEISKSNDELSMASEGQVNYWSATSGILDGDSACYKSGFNTFAWACFHVLPDSQTCLPQGFNPLPPNPPPGLFPPSSVWLRPVTDQDHIEGDQDASVTLIEYGDYECPYTKMLHPVMQQLLSEFSGQVRWVYRHFPLSYHANAQKEAESGECVAELGGNGMFWDFTNKLLDRTQSGGSGFALENLAPLAAEVGVDGGMFQDCLNSGKYADVVNLSEQWGITAGVTGTPYTFILSHPNQPYPISGAIGYEQLKGIVQALQ